MMNCESCPLYPAVSRIDEAELLAQNELLRFRDEEHEVVVAYNYQTQIELDEALFEAECETDVSLIVSTARLAQALENIDAFVQKSERLIAITPRDQEARKNKETADCRGPILTKKYRWIGKVIQVQCGSQSRIQRIEGDV